MTIWTVADDQQQISLTGVFSGDEVDDELGFEIPADGSYDVEIWAIFTTIANCDISTSWLMQSGLTGVRACFGATSNSGTFTSRVDTNGLVRVADFTTANFYQLDTSGLGQLVYERGLLVNAVQGDTLQFVWSQVTPQYSNLIRNSVSYIKATEVTT